MLLSSRFAKHLTVLPRFKNTFNNSPYNLFASKNKPSTAQPKKGTNVPIAPQQMKLVFEKDNKALIFEHMNGSSDLKWLVRANLALMALNAFLFVAETTQPIFGGWNYLSFSIGLGTGIAATIALNVLSKRTIHKMKLFRSGDYVELTFFNAYWIPKTKVYHVTEFANMIPTYFNYTRSEITSLGKVWINLEKNVYNGLPEYDELTKEVLNGRIIKLSKIDSVLNKYNQYKKQ